MIPTTEELSLHMPLVHQVVARFLGRLPPNVLREDLVAAGTFGLVDALRKNPSAQDRGAQFDWYARIRIRGAILDELRSQDWLSRRARTRVTAEHGKDAARGSAVMALDEMPAVFATDPDPTPHELVESRREHEALERAVGALPAREQQIIRWHYFEGVQFKDIAQKLKVSEPRISQLHSRAVGMLRSAMA